MSYINNALFIQKVWKSYRTRNKIKVLFIDLPRDLQRKIIYYISEPVYLKYMSNSIKKIIYIRINTFWDNIDTYKIIFHKENSIYDYLSHIQVTDLINLIRLIDKYYVILDIDKLNFFIYIINTLNINYHISSDSVTKDKLSWDIFLRYYNILKMKI